MWFSSPHGDFSFSINTGYLSICNPLVFVPSRGFLFFYAVYMALVKALKKFSSPHGDFSFSMLMSLFIAMHDIHCFRPLTGISLFLWLVKSHKKMCVLVFVPSRGFLFFYRVVTPFTCIYFLFSSPHGDFSFSMEQISWELGLEFCFRPLTGISLFL